MPDLVSFGRIVSEKMTKKSKNEHFSQFFTLFKVTVTLTLTNGLDMHMSLERSFNLLYYELGLVVLGSIHSEKNPILWKNPYFDPFSRSLRPWPSVKVAECSIIFKPLSHTTPMPNLVTVGQIVSEKTLRFRFSTDGRTHARMYGRTDGRTDGRTTDAGGALHRTHFCIKMHVSPKKKETYLRFMEPRPCTGRRNWAFPRPSPPYIRQRLHGTIARCYLGHTQTYQAGQWVACARHFYFSFR